MKVRFTKLPKHKRFDYTPRYYNEQKERLEERKRQIEAQQSEKKTREDINISFRRSSSYDKKYRARHLMMANIRLVVILGLIIALMYYFFIHLDNFTLIIEKLTQ